MKPFPGKSLQETNKINGQFFEETFERFARYQGFLPLKNKLSAQPKGLGRWQPIKSQLDYNVYKVGGQCAIVDCKTFDEGRFTYSRIDDKQLEKSVQFNRWKIPSGFVVYFREPNLVSFFSGYEIERRGKRSEFVASTGKILGRLENFIIGPIFDPTIPQPEFY